MHLQHSISKGGQFLILSFSSDAICTYSIQSVKGYDFRTPIIVLHCRDVRNVEFLHDHNVARI